MKCMDYKSQDYPVYARNSLQALRERSEISAFIKSELKKLGYKPKAMGYGIYCDRGSGKNRIALAADIASDVQAAVLLYVARLIGKKCRVPLRFIFMHDADGMIECGVTSGVAEAYSLRACRELEQGKIGYCYGTACAGRCDFDLSFGQSGSAKQAASSVFDIAVAAAESRGLTAEISGDGSYIVTMFDMCACEAFMLDIERAALSADDTYGTCHMLTARRAVRPLVNDAYAVDRVRSVMGDRCVRVEPSPVADEFSCFTEATAGCLVELGAADMGETCETALLTGAELFVGLIESHRR